MIRSGKNMGDRTNVTTISCQWRALDLGLKSIVLSQPASYSHIFLLHGFGTFQDPFEPQWHSSLNFFCLCQACQWKSQTIFRSDFSVFD
ncbi:hypothetical protein VTL71DRAFT_4415, partial [Oculimacula yallundae]